MRTYFAISLPRCSPFSIVDFTGQLWTPLNSAAQHVRETASQHSGESLSRHPAFILFILELLQTSDARPAWPAGQPSWYGPKGFCLIFPPACVKGCSANSHACCEFTSGRSSLKWIPRLPQMTEMSRSAACWMRHSQRRWPPRPEVFGLPPLTRAMRCAPLLPFVAHAARSGRRRKLLWRCCCSHQRSHFGRVMSR